MSINECKININLKKTTTGNVYTRCCVALIIMKTMKIKDLKKLLSGLESKLGDLDDLEIFIRPIGTPSQPVYNMGVGTYEHGVDEVGKKKEVFCVYLEGDVF